MAKNTLDLLDNISMQLRDISGKMEKSNKEASLKKDSGSAGNTGSSAVFSGKSIFNFKFKKEDGEALSEVGKGLASLGKGLLDLKKAGKPKKLENYLNLIEKFVKSISNMGSEKVLKQASNVNKSASALATALTRLFEVMTPGKMMSIWLASKMMSKKTGERIGKFYAAIIKEMEPAVKKGNKEFIKAMIDLINGVASFMKTSLLILAGLTLIAAFKPSALIKGMIALTALIGLTLGTIWALTKIMKKMDKESKKGLKQFMDALRSLVISIGILAIIALASQFIPISGLLMTITLLTMGVMTLKMISSTVKEHGKSMLMGTLAFAVLLLSLVAALAIIRTMVSSERKIVQTMAGLMVLTIVVTGALIVMKKLGSLKVSKDLTFALANMIVLTIVIAMIGITIKKLLIPIGKKWEAALLGTGIMSIILVEMYLIIKKLGNPKILVDAKRATAGALALVAVGFAMWEAAKALEIIANTFDNDIGKAVLALGVATAVAGGLYLFGKAIGKLGSKLSIAEIGKGSLAIIAAGGVMLVLAWLSSITVDMLKKIDEYGIGKFGLDLLEVVGIVSGFGLVLAGIGALVSFPPVAIALAAGAAALLGVAAVLAGVATCVDTILPVLKRIDKLGWSSEEIQEKSNNLANMVIMFIEPYADNIGTLASIAFLAGPLINIIAWTVIPPLNRMYNKMFDLFKTFVDFLSELGMRPEDLANENNPYNLLCKNLATSFVTFFQEVSRGLRDIGVFAAIITTIIAVTLMPVLDLISKFIDVVEKVATMHVITGYDENGKPKFRRLPPNVFVESAQAISKGFNGFFTKIKDELATGSMFFAAFVMNIIADELMPVLDLVSKFVDIVSKVATMTIITGYDENGNPEFKKLPPDVFEKSAIAVSNGFKAFLEGLNDGFSAISFRTIMIMDLMTDMLKPIMDAVSQFVNAIIALATAQYIEDWEVITDKDGKNPVLKPIYGDIPCIRGGKNWAEDAAITISEQFGFFINTLADSSEKLKDGGSFLGFTWGTVGALEVLSETIKPIMDSVSQFTDAIIKLATAQIVIGYDEKGKPIMQPLPPGWAESSAQTITQNFGYFINSLASGVEHLSGDAEDALEVIAETIGPIMQGVGSYAEAIVRLGQCKYEVSGYDEKGNPIYDLSKPIDYKQVGVDLADTFITFVKSFATMAKDNEDLFDDAEDALEILSEVLNPIFDSLNKYTSSIEKLMKKVGGNKEAGTEGDAIWTKLREITTEVTGGINDIFQGQYGLSQERLKSWGLDDDETVDMYNNLAKVMKNISKCANELKNIADKFGTDEEQNGMNVKNIMQNLADAVLVWANTNFPDAINVMESYIPQLRDNFKLISELFRDAKKDTEELKSSVKGISGQLEADLNRIKNIITSGFNAIKDNLSVLEKLLRNSLSTVSEIFKEVGDDAQALISDINELDDTLNTVIVDHNDERIKALTELKQSFDKVTESVDKVKQSIQELAKQDFETLSNNINMVAESFMKAFEEHNAMNAIANPGEFLDAVADAGKDVFNTVTSPIKSGVDVAKGVITAGTDLAGAAWQKGKEVLGIPVQTPAPPTYRNITVYFGAKAFHGRIDLS